MPTTGYPAWGGGGITSFLRKAERADRQCDCGVKETVDCPGHVGPDINSGYGTDAHNKREGFEEAVPGRSGTAIV